MKSMKRRKIKESILKLLKDSSDGLTIQQIADSLKISRITATKYLHELLGSKDIYEKRIGVYRLFFIKQRFLKPVTDKEILERLRRKVIS